MHPIEIRARREALGLSQADLAALLDPPVKQATISMWESGSRAPRDPVSLHLRFCELEGLLYDLIEITVRNLVHASGVLNSPNVEARTYSDDETYWQSDAEARRLRIPASMHRVAVATAAVEVREEHEIDAAIISR